MSIIKELKDKLKDNLDKTKKKKTGKNTAWSIVSMSVITILILAIFGSAYFAYNNIYLTLSNAHSIFLLESQLGAENINTKAYNLAVQAIEKKQEQTNVPEDLRNIFEYGETPIIPTSTSSTINTTTFNSTTTKTDE